MKTHDSDGKKKTPRHKKRLIALAVSIWVSFLSAGVATMLFFSAFDPSVIAQFATYPVALSRSSGYSMGFLLFWLLLVVNSAAIIWLLGRKPK